jgi:hypothetical protein
VEWIVLAQQRKPPIDLWIACAVLIAMIVLLGTVVLLYRRSVLRGSEVSGGRDAWDLDDLHRLKSEGEITEAEYQAMRATIIRSFTGQRTGDPGGRLPELPPDAFPSGSVPREPESDDDQAWDWVAEGYEGDGKRRKSDT